MRAQRKFIVTLLAVAALLLAAAGRSSAIEKPGLVQEEFVFETAPFPSCHAATIAETDRGLVCAFFGGTAERNPDVCIWVCRKDRDADQWTPPVEVANGVHHDAETGKDVRDPTWNPVLFQSRSGELMLFYKVGPKPADWWGMLTTSNDGGRTWDVSRKLRYNSGNNNLIGPAKNKPLQLASGELIAGSSTEAGGGKIRVERSSDGGKTWQIVGPFDDPNKLSPIQPTLLTLPGGVIQMLCRTGSAGVMAESRSSDGGKTWSPLAAGPLPNNNSGIDGVTLADGRQLLVYNHTTRDQADAGHKGRGILNVAIRNDSVANSISNNWQAALVLERTSENKQYSYPSVIQSRDGLVHIVYTWDRQRIKHAVLDPAQLKTQPIVDGKWPESIQ